MLNAHKKNIAVIDSYVKFKSAYWSQKTEGEARKETIIARNEAVFENRIRQTAQGKEAAQKGKIYHFRRMERVPRLGKDSRLRTPTSEHWKTFVVLAGGKRDASISYDTKVLNYNLQNAHLQCTKIRK